ncbi:unnamed protein product [Rotaria sp. Silwood1]|nr:unnamed protein product [Rotaria sp. Silwood1]
MPAIVLINPGQAGSLLGVLKTPAEEEAAAIWVEPAYIRVLGQGIVNTQATSCGCCPSPYCQMKAKPCSLNLDCECLLMTMTGRGMCADTVVSCTD